MMLKRISLTMSIDLNYFRREEREREREKREREESVCREGVSEQVDLKRASASERFFLALLLGERHAGGQNACVFAHVRAFSGVVP
jgi:hypothetical protein